MAHPLKRRVIRESGRERGDLLGGPGPCQGGYTRSMQGDKALRAELVKFLSTEAHMSLAEAVKNFSVKDMNVRPPNVPYTFWHLLEHIRIAQWDIIDFIRNPRLRASELPQGLRAGEERQGDQEGLGPYHRHLSSRPTGDDRHRQESEDGSPRPHPPRGRTDHPARGILIVDHTSYHVGEFAILRQVVNNWK